MGTTNGVGSNFEFWKKDDVSSKGIKTWKSNHGKVLNHQGL